MPVVMVNARELARVRSFRLGDELVSSWVNWSEPRVFLNVTKTGVILQRLTSKKANRQVVLSLPHDTRVRVATPHSVLSELPLLARMCEVHKEALPDAFLDEAYDMMERMRDGR